MAHQHRAEQQQAQVWDQQQRQTHMQNLKMDHTVGAGEAVGTRAAATEKATDEARAEAKAPGEAEVQAVAANPGEVETIARTRVQVAEYHIARQPTTSKK